MRPTLHTADVLAYAAGYTGEPYHALLCDPPYELAFMSRSWDRTGIAFRPATWAAFMPLLHPGAFGMAFAGSRGLHRMMGAIEDAGYLIHPVIGWCYGSGFPKASRIDTQIDAAAGVEREIVGHEDGRSRYDNAVRQPREKFTGNVWNNGEAGGTTAHNITAPATDLARDWAGHRYGLQALKPALEFIVVFQKPYQGRPVESMVATGAGALNIDGARVRSTDVLARPYNDAANQVLGTFQRFGNPDEPSGRWPANLVLSHAPECERIGTRRVRGHTGYPNGPGGKSHHYSSDKRSDEVRPNAWEGYADADGLETVDAWRCVPGCAVAALGAQSGESVSRPDYRNEPSNTGASGIYGDGYKRQPNGVNDTGTAARYFFAADYAAERLEAAEPLFYCAKSSTAEREAGLSGRHRTAFRGNYGDGIQDNRPHTREGYEYHTTRANIHPTCKPIALARHLATLLLPPALYAPRRLFVPFAGVASECIGAMQAGWETVDGVELEAEHVEIGRARIAWWAEQGVQLSLFDE